MANSDTKHAMFHIGDVLTVTTKRLLSPRGLDGLYHILRYMTGEQIYTRQIPRALQACAPFVLEDHPWTKEAGEQICNLIDAETDNSKIPHIVRDFLVTWTLKIGCSNVVVLPLAPGQWLSVDPVEEMKAMIVDERVIRVEI